MQRVRCSVSARRRPVSTKQEGRGEQVVLAEQQVTVVGAVGEHLPRLSRGEDGRHQAAGLAEDALDGL